MLNYLKEENRCYFIATTIVSLGVAYLVKKILTVLKAEEKQLRSSGLGTNDVIKHDLKATDVSNEVLTSTTECEPDYKCPSSKGSIFSSESSDSLPTQDATSTLDQRNLDFASSFLNRETLPTKTDIPKAAEHTLVSEFDITLSSDVDSPKLEILPSEDILMISNDEILTEASTSVAVTSSSDEISDSEIEISQTDELSTSGLKYLSEKFPISELKFVMPGEVSAPSPVFNISPVKQSSPTSEQEGVTMTEQESLPSTTELEYLPADGNLITEQNIFVSKGSSKREILQSQTILQLLTDPEKPSSETNLPRPEVLYAKSSTVDSGDLESPTREKFLSAPGKSEQEILSLVSTKFEISLSENSHAKQVSQTSEHHSSLDKVHLPTLPTSKQAIQTFKLVLSRNNPLMEEHVVDINIKHYQGLTKEIDLNHSKEERNVQKEHFTDTTCNDDFPLDAVPLEMIYKIIPLTMT